MISQLNVLATSMLKLVFPTAVGPTSTNSFGLALLVKRNHSVHNFGMGPGLGIKT